MACSHKLCWPQGHVHGLKHFLVIINEMTCYPSKLHYGWRTRHWGACMIFFFQVHHFGETVSKAEVYLKSSALLTKLRLSCTAISLLKCRLACAWLVWSMKWLLIIHLIGLRIARLSRRNRIGKWRLLICWLIRLLIAWLNRLLIAWLIWLLVACLTGLLISLTWLQNTRLW